ncbi:MAG TPA: branched-chain amino acid ABC transporter permease, partial [Solirubrobacteraceae bacterium]|nr:branched-chain amino acid ABC transporter permease [Solirubrobacteraceae bacterium]
MDPIRFALLGIGAGAIYALAAQGIVLVYRGSGVLNFAHGAMGMVAAFVFYDLRGGPHWPALLCFGVAVPSAAAIGALTHLLVMRPLRHASGLARLIATLGVLTLLQASASQLWGNDFRVVTGILPDSSITPLPHTTIGVDRVWLFGIAAALTTVLMLVYRYTRFGRATGAVSENPRALAALGHSPDVIATVNWAAGAGLAGIGAIFIVPLTSLQVNSLTLLVVPALAAALVGGFASFPLTLLGGMAIGVAESEMARYVTAGGWAQSVPFLAIIAVLVLRGRALPLRGDTSDRPPELGTGQVRPLAVLSAFVAGGALIWFVFSASWTDAAITTLTVGIVVLSFVVVTGFAGQLS